MSVRSMPSTARTTPRGRAQAVEHAAADREVDLEARRARQELVGHAARSAPAPSVSAAPVGRPVIADRRRGRPRSHRPGRRDRRAVAARRVQVAGDPDAVRT